MASIRPTRRASDWKGRRGHPRRWSRVPAQRLGSGCCGQPAWTGAASGRRGGGVGLSTGVTGGKLAVGRKSPHPHTRNDLRPPVQGFSGHRPKTGEFGPFQLDTWQDFASRLLMFEGMDLKCVGVSTRPPHKRTHPMCKIPFRSWIANAGRTLEWTPRLGHHASPAGQLQSADRLRPRSKGGSGRRDRTRRRTDTRGKGPKNRSPRAGKSPDCGTGWIRPSSFRWPSN